MLSFILGHSHHLLLHLNLLLHLHGAFRSVLLHQLGHVLLLLLGVFLVLRASGYLVGLFFEGQSKGTGKQFKRDCVLFVLLATSFKKLEESLFRGVVSHLVEDHLEGL